MTNDTTTLNGALTELGELMAQNLNDKGVTASANDGLTTLATKILDVTPFITGLDLSTSLTIETSYKANTIHKPIDFHTQLKCFFDDLSAADVDLTGYLQGATINFYSNNILIDSGITNVNGEVDFSFIPIALGTFPVYISFAGTDNYGSSQSQIFTILVVNEILLNSITQIIQNGQSLNITATIPDIEGETNLANRDIILCREIDDTGWDLDLDVSDEIIQTGDTATFTTEVTDNNGDPVENIVINLYIEE